MAFKESSSVDQETGKDIETKTGKGLVCIKWKKENLFTCEFQISAKKLKGDDKGGIIMDQKAVTLDGSGNAIETAAPEIQNGSPISADIQGDLIQILKRDGNVVQFLMKGSANEKVSKDSDAPSFKKLFEAISVYGTTTDGNGVTVATGKEIKCYYNPKLTDDHYSCEVRFLIRTGTPQAVSDWEKNE
jgi:hypothetical protein